MDPAQQSVLHSTFRCVPNGAGLVRIVEESDGERSLHAMCPVKNTTEVVESVVREYSAAYFIGLCNKVSGGENNGS
jgi:hypothetical protein